MLHIATTVQTGHIANISRSKMASNEHLFEFLKTNINVNILRPSQMAAIFQTTFSDAFLWMKNVVFWLKFITTTVQTGHIGNISRY